MILQRDILRGEFSVLCRRRWVLVATEKKGQQVAGPKKLHEETARQFSASQWGGLRLIGLQRLL
jgi:hypothetical protein